MESLDEIIKYNKFLSSAYLDKADLLIGCKKFSEAIITYDELIQVNKWNMSDISVIEALNNFIISRHKCLEDRKASIKVSLKEAYWEKAEALSNLNKIQEANYCKGLALYHSNETNDHEKAIVFFDQALEKAKKDINSNNIALYNFYKGCSLIKLRDPEKNFEAIEYFNNAYDNSKHQNIQIFLQAFIYFNRKIIECSYSNLDKDYINDLIKKRENCIEDFTNKVILNLNDPNSYNIIDSNINSLTKKLAELNASLSSEINEMSQIATSDSTEQHILPIGEDSKNIEDNL